MLGQAHHFLGNVQRGKAPYAEERYGAEAKRLYGVLDRRLADVGNTLPATIRSPILRSGHGRPVSNGNRSRCKSSSPTVCPLVHRDRRPPPAVIKGYNVPAQQPPIPMP